MLKQLRFLISRFNKYCNFLAKKGVPQWLEIDFHSLVVYVIEISRDIERRNKRSRKRSNTILVDGGLFGNGLHAGSIFSAQPKLI